MLYGWSFRRSSTVSAWCYMGTSWSLGSMMGLCVLPVQMCMRNRQEAKGLCILDANEMEPSSENSELLLSCDDYCITYNTQAFAWKIFTATFGFVSFSFEGNVYFFLLPPKYYFWYNEMLFCPVFSFSAKQFSFDRIHILSQCVSFLFLIKQTSSGLMFCCCCCWTLLCYFINNLFLSNRMGKAHQNFCIPE